MVGPRFSLRRKKVTPFGHVLFGAAHTNISGTATTLSVPPPQPATFAFSDSSTNFAFSPGGGVDLKIAERVAWRVQIDGLLTGYHSQTFNFVRVSTGVVFHF
jgi:hypothetical protein